MMRILVTGGDGFIGRHLVNTLLERGDHVHIIDNHVTSSPRITHANLTRTIGDVCNLRKLIPTVKPEVIIHLASVAIPLLYMEKPELVIYPNVFGTEEVCNLAEKCNARVIYSSSSEVYGSIIDKSPIGTSIRESEQSLNSLLNPRSPYSTSKKMGEEIISASIRNGLSACSVRLFNVVGPNMDADVSGYGRVIPNFVEALNESRPLTIYGTGEQTRCFLWVGDAIDALIRLVDIDGTLPKAINIGHPESVTILSLAEKFQSMTGRRVGVSHRPALPHEPIHRCPDISLAESVLGWRPRMTLDEIIFNITDSEVKG